MPCSTPELADPIYKRLRTPQMVREDHKKRSGLPTPVRRGRGRGELPARVLSHARESAASRCRRPSLDPPRPGPDNGARAVLKITPAAFESATRRRALAIFLQRELGEDRIRESSRDGDYELDSMSVLQDAESMSKAITNYMAKDRELPARSWRTALAKTGLVEFQDPEKRTVGVTRRERGSMYLQTITDGRDDGEVEFQLYDGEVTKQMTLMWRLLLEWRGGWILEQSLRCSSPRYIGVRENEDREQMALIRKRVQTSRARYREKKLPPDQVSTRRSSPRFRSPSQRHQPCACGSWDLDRQRLGHLESAYPGLGSQIERN